MEDLFEIVGKGSPSLDILARDRVDKAQYHCMETLPVCSKGTFFAAAIYCVSQQGMSGPGHMNADLMCSSGLQSALYVGIISEALKHTDMCDGLFSVRAYSHLLPVRRVTSYGLGNSEFVLPDISQDDGSVPAHNGMLGQLAGNALMGSIIFADNNTAGGVFVDAMDDSGTHYTVYAGQASFAMVQHSIDQGAAVMASSRMHDHVLGLIDDQNIFVFVKDIEGNIFRKDVRKHLDRQENREGLSPAHRRAWLKGFGPG